MISISQNSLCLGIAALIMLIGITSSACTKKTNELMDPQEKYQLALAYAQSQLGNSSKVIPNEDKTLFLCLKVTKPRTNYIVTDIEQQTILARKSANGTVKWYSNTSISVQDLPNVLQDKSSKPSDFIKIVELNQPL